jgi:hypothetical protein
MSRPGPSPESPRPGRQVLHNDSKRVDARESGCFKNEGCLRWVTFAWLASIQDMRKGNAF